MAEMDLARDYISRVNARDGDGAAELFTDDGVIIDPRGERHQGRQAIAEFVNAATPGTIAHVADRRMAIGQVVLHGTIMTDNLAPAEVEWVFATKGDQIDRLTIRTVNG